VENKEYIAALKEHDSKSIPRFYELWKKNTMVYESDQLNKWRESISYKSDELANGKENYLKTPLAKQFIDNYINEQITLQDNNQKKVQEINLKREDISGQRREIAKINFTASQIKNNDVTITVNGNIKDLKKIVPQANKITNQLLKSKANETKFNKPLMIERYR